MWLKFQDIVVKTSDTIGNKKKCRFVTMLHEEQGKFELDENK